MNTVALNNRLSVQFDNSSMTAAQRAAAESRPFSACLAAQLSGCSAGTPAENGAPRMTLNEAAALTGWNAVPPSGAEDQAASDPAIADTTLLEASGSPGDANSALMALLLMLFSNNSGESNGMSAAMMSLLSSINGESLGGLLSASGLSGLASVLGGQTTNATGQGIVEQALTRLGDPYSKSKRGTGNYVDCSYLAQWAYKKMGINIPGTAAKQAQYCYENGYEISKDELKPGDLIFWTKHSSNAGRWRNIHHVAIYMGNGRIVEAKNPKNGVEVGDIWGREGNGGDWEIVMYARPR